MAVYANTDSILVFLGSNRTGCWLFLNLNIKLSQRFIATPDFCLDPRDDQRFEREPGNLETEVTENPVSNHEEENEQG